MNVIKVGTTKLTGHSLKKPDLTNKKKLAEKFRNNPTKSEKRLCEMLGAAGISFKFQHVLHGYIADFYFPDRSWIVELDGYWHDIDKDNLRDEALRKKGIRTLRLKSKTLFSEPAIALREIVETLRLTTQTKRKKRNRRLTERGSSVDSLHAEFMFITQGI